VSWLDEILIDETDSENKHDQSSGDAHAPVKNSPLSSFTLASGNTSLFLRRRWLMPAKMKPAGLLWRWSGTFPLTHMTVSFNTSSPSELNL
jgi:hypothetical protein